MNVIENGSTRIVDFHSWAKKKTAKFINLDDIGVVSALNRFDSVKNTNMVDAVRAKAYLENARNQAFASKDFTTGAKLTAGMDKMT